MHVIMINIVVTVRTDVSKRIIISYHIFIKKYENLIKNFKCYLVED